MNKYLVTDEFEEAISSLEMAFEAVSAVLEDIYRWKWAILGFHNALQGFMVLSLRGTDGLNVLKDRDKEKWLRAHYNKTTYPNGKLDSFLNLYKKIKSDKMFLYDNRSQIFVPKDTQEYSIRRLNSLRNEFIHFVPKGWSLETSGLPDICLNCIDVIKFLGWQCGNVFWYEPNVEARAKKSIDEVEQAVKKI